MKLLAVAILSSLLVGCGGGTETARFSATTASHVSILSEGMRTQSVATAPSITVARVYQALNGKASANAAFASAVIQVGSTNGFDWANLQAAAKANLSDSAFATLVLNNISITPTSLTSTAAFGTSQQAYDGLQRALTEYLAVFAPKGVGRGTVVLQLANIIAGLEIDNTFGVYGPAAIAFNKQITANVAYSSITTNTTDAVVAIPAASAQTQATCNAYLATNPNPSAIRAVTGIGVTQRTALLAAGGKLVAIGPRYYLVYVPSTFYTAANSAVVLELPGTGGYPEAGWNDWNASMAEQGHAFISLYWGGGTNASATDVEIYSDLKKIIQDVGASCPIAKKPKWLMGFSVGSAYSFAVMIRDVADLKLFKGQLALSGAAIGPLTTGRDLMHPTVESNRTNALAVASTKSWMYCGDKDFDHGWSMCTEMPNGVAFVNTHGGLATLYSDPSGTHNSLPANVAGRKLMFDFMAQP